MTVVLLAALCPSSAPAETRMVRRGQNLQSALNSAVPGDVIVLEAGAEFVGSFTLPVKTGSAPIVVQSETAAELPEEGRRISPAHAGRLQHPAQARNVGLDHSDAAGRRGCLIQGVQQALRRHPLAAPEGQRAQHRSALRRPQVQRLRASVSFHAAEEYEPNRIRRASPFLDVIHRTSETPCKQTWSA